MSCTSSYLTNALHFDLVKKNVKGIVARLKLWGIEFDGIAFTGMSGALVAPMVADKMKKKLLMVRKDGDVSHSSYAVEGHRDVKRYIVLDDLVCTGTSVRNVVKGVLRMRHSYELTGLECVGVFCWYERYYDVDNCITQMSVPDSHVDISISKSVPRFQCIAVDKISDAEEETVMAWVEAHKPAPTSVTISLDLAAAVMDGRL